MPIGSDYFLQQIERKMGRQLGYSVRGRPRKAIGKKIIPPPPLISGSIRRSFNVVSGTTRKDISAEFADGVLTLSATRSKGEKVTRGSHQIPIR